MRRSIGSHPSALSAAASPRGRSRGVVRRLAGEGSQGQGGDPALCMDWAQHTSLGPRAPRKIGGGLASFGELSTSNWLYRAKIYGTEDLKFGSSRGRVGAGADGSGTRADASGPQR